MKKLLMSIALSVSCLAVVYLMGVFIVWDWNPGKWPDVGRFVFAWIGGCGSIGAGCALYFKDQMS